MTCPQCGSARKVMAEGLREFIQALRQEGIGDRDLAVMTREAPARLLGLD